MTQAYPLQWPIQRPRTPWRNRKNGSFEKSVQKNGEAGTVKSTRYVTIGDATERLLKELRLLGASDVIISSNRELRRDGLPRSGQSQPADPGVAVYFRSGGKPICLPCDTYTDVAQNMAAIANHIDATRRIERYGVASVAEMFTGFVAIADHPHWSSVLGVTPTASRVDIEAAYRRLAQDRHPDKPGGSEAMMADLNRARDEARKERP